MLQGHFQKSTVLLDRFREKKRHVLCHNTFTAYSFVIEVCGDIKIPHKERNQNSLPLTTNFSQKLTQPSKGIRYPVVDLCRCFTKRTLPSTHTLHSNPIPPTDGTNGFL